MWWQRSHVAVQPHCLYHIYIHTRSMLAASSDGVQIYCSPVKLADVENSELSFIVLGSLQICHTVTVRLQSCTWITWIPHLGNSWSPEVNRHCPGAHNSAQAAPTIALAWFQKTAARSQGGQPLLFSILWSNIVIFPKREVYDVILCCVKNGET